MAKVNEIIFDIREAVRQYTDDSELDDRYILYLYSIKRSKYLKQKLNNYQRTTDISVLQTFCESLEEVSSNECSVSLTCDKILRTKRKVPQPIDLHSKVAITKVKPTEILSVPFNFISKDKAPYVANSPFSKAIYSFLDPNGYIYVFSNSDVKMLECLTVTGVFQNPLALKNYTNCCDCEDSTICFDENTSDYPIQSELIDIIREEIVKDIIRTKQIPEDTENDAENS